MGDEEDAEAVEDAAAMDRQPDGWHKANKDGADEADAAEDADVAADDPQRRPHGNATTIGIIATVVATASTSGIPARHAHTTCVTRGTTRRRRSRTPWAEAAKPSTKPCYQATQDTRATSIGCRGSKQKDRVDRALTNRCQRWQWRPCNQTRGRCSR